MVLGFLADRKRVVCLGRMGMGPFSYVLKGAREEPPRASKIHTKDGAKLSLAESIPYFKMRKH